MKYLLTLTYIVFTFCNTFSQGKLMLVGGGTELDDSWSWSNTPYQWAVDQSANKRVAIIAFGESSDPQWLPDYFVSLGAIDSKNFIINTSDSAQSQVTYDTLMNYDVFFFKGGDQSNYYSTYKDSKVTEAITDKYAAGGVIAGTSAGMAIISEIVYTAESGTLYPDQALSDISHQNITLKNDFINIFSGFVVDTHFIERGRHARLAAFIGNWLINESENIMGIGVDDRTAFCIDENKIGTVYGTGAVTLLSSDHFTQQNGKPVADSIHAAALLHNQQYDLNAKTIISELTEEIGPEVEEESGMYTLYLSGSDQLDENNSLLTEAIPMDDSVVLVSNHQSNAVNEFVDYIESNIGRVFPLYVAENADSCESTAIRNIIRLSEHFIFLDNDLQNFIHFLNETATGRALNEKIRQDNSTSIFLGEDAKLAGKHFVTNNTQDELNAYYGDLEFAAGTGLLKTTTIIPDAYDPGSSDFYENNTAAAFYMLGHFNLKYAALINRNSYLKYYAAMDSTWADSFGDYSAMLITNNATSGGFADQQVNSEGDVRQVAGYDQLKMSIIHEDPLYLGNATSNSSGISALELPVPTAVEATASENLITLLWTDNSQNEQGFIIERSVNESDFALLEELPANSEQYTDLDIEPGSDYQYRIQAISSDQVSCFSEIASIAVVTNLNEFIGIGNDILVYPNPVANGEITLECNFDGFVEIIDPMGKQLIEKEIKTGITKINVAYLPAGILYLRLFDSSGANEEKYISILNTK